MALESKINRLQNVAAKYQEKLTALQSRRLLLGLAFTGLLIASQIIKGAHLELLAVFLVLPIFIYFFRRSRNLQNFFQELEHLKDFYQRQLQMSQGYFSKEWDPEEMANPSLARDLDLGVLFANMDLSFTEESQNLLNQWLCQEFGDSTRVRREQFIKELVQSPGLLRRLQINPLEQKASLQRIKKEVERSFFERPIPWKILLPIFWFLMLALLFSPLPSLYWKVALLCYAGASLFFIGETKHLFSRLQDLEGDLSRLKQKITLVEKLAHKLSLTPELKKHQASKDVQTLGRLISFMSVKTNPILFYLLNFIVPWDYLLAELSERSRRNLQKHFSLWSAEVVMIETCGSLANLKLFHHTTWAHETSEGPFIKVQELAHPLLDQKKVVKNSFDPKEHRIFIITGSNMSGKSTFLRAIGINFCLANIGAPVFAHSFEFKEQKLMTCIRVSDSLRDGQSYFYAEVQRMKSILNGAKEQNILFLIDEPLRGTNNRERLIGNKKYLQQMLEKQGQGFICTHDLELTQLAEEDPAIDNAHFTEQWQNEDLIFDYKIKEGPSKSTNALKILAKEGLYPMDQIQ